MNTQTNSIFSRGVSSLAFVAVFVASFFLFFYPKNDALAWHINVCQILVDSDGEVISGSFPAGTFTLNWVSGSDSPSGSNGILPSTNWDTTSGYTLNTTLVSGSTVNDAVCKTYPASDMVGSYYYSEEIIPDGWEPTLYNDQKNITDTYSLTSDFSVYNPSSKITLTNSNYVRTLVVLNKQKAKPVCSDGIDNDSDGKIDYPADPGCDSPDDNDENAAPIAVLVAPTTAYKNVSITLDGVGSYDSDGTIATYVWNFGDGSAELTTNAPASTTPHSYTTNGTYTVKLKVTDNKGVLSTEVTKSVVVSDAPVNPQCSDGIDNDSDGKIDYPVDPGCDSSTDDDENDTPIAVLVVPATAYKNTVIIIDGVGSYDTDGTVATYIWNFGDGSAELTTTAPASTTPHTFGTLGTTTVTLKVTDNKGATSTSVVKDILITDKPINPQCSDGIDNDGDGKIDHPIDPGCDSPEDNDENFIPVAVLIAPATAYKNTAITLDGVGSYDSDGTIATYIWNFGDGSAELTTNAPASTTPHTFANLGTTTVTLKVTDNKGATSTMVVKDILIKDIPTYPVCSDGKDNDGDGKIDAQDPACHTGGDPEKPYIPTFDSENSAPIAVLLVPATSNINTSVTVDGIGSYDLDGTVVSYVWNFGDGSGILTTTAPASTTPHTYTANGTYTVTLKVTDDKGLEGKETTKTIVVSTPVVPPPPPPPSGCSGNCGGSVIVPSLIITNEVLEPGVIAGTSIVRWNTNIPADSRVVYGNSSVTSWTAGDQKYGYPKTTITVPALVTSHTIAIAGIDPNTTNYFRPVSKTSSLSATGKELVSVPSTCYYLREFIKLGANNNPVEVKKLQVFLNEFEGANLPVTGIYTIPDFNAVTAFQNKYKTSVIDPWGETTRGYVYLTTKKQVNEIYCRTAFPLNDIESAEVNAYRALILELRAQGIVVPTQEETPNNTFVPQTGLVNGTNDALISLLKEEGKTPALSATNTKTASVTNRGALRNMLAGAYGAVSGAVANYWFVLILLALLIPTGFYAKKMLKEEEDTDEAEPIL